MAKASDSVSEIDTLVAEPPYKKRVAQFDYYYDVRTFTWKLRKSLKQKKSDKDKYAVLIRRQINTKGIFVGSVVDVTSPRLREVLLGLNEGVEGIELSRTVPTVSEDLMYYSYPGLIKRLAVEEAREDRDELLICDIQAGIFYVEEYLGNKVRDVQQLLSLQEISFDTLWAIFIPNTHVYHRHTDTDQDMLLLCRSSSYEIRPRDESKYFRLCCDVIHNDGHSLGFARHIIEVNDFPGTRPISSFEFYPLKYHVNKELIYSKAVELGKRALQLPTHSFREITGRGCRTEPYKPRRRGRYDDEDEDDSRKKPMKQPVLVNGRVMISPSAYKRFHAAIEPEVHRPLNKKNLTEDQYAVFSPIASGYAIDRKIWGEFALSRASDVDWNDTAFDELVLGSKQKKLIKSLVLQHSKKQSGFDDIIKGKGQGLIGLLSGTPGCGKTLTAEAVAEVTHKPLYTLSAGELGITPDSLEDALNRAFDLAQMWDAVVLLDEAEVFLTQRNFSDLERNALVSIFLRRLEYYQGILILTTNMPKNFDHAFQSRIHFSINYPELDFDARKTIWALFFKRSSIEVPDDQLNRLASYSINGRQIKNTFSSAITINEAEDSPPGSFLQNLDIVLDVLNEWDQAKVTHDVELL